MGLLKNHIDGTEMEKLLKNHIDGTEMEMLLKNGDIIITTMKEKLLKNGDIITTTMKEKLLKNGDIITTIITTMKEKLLKNHIDGIEMEQLLKNHINATEMEQLLKNGIITTEMEKLLKNGTIINKTTTTTTELKHGVETTLSMPFIKECASNFLEHLSKKLLSTLSWLRKGLPMVSLSPKDIAQNTSPIWSTKRNQVVSTSQSGHDPSTVYIYIHLNP